MTEGKKLGRLDKIVHSDSSAIKHLEYTIQRQHLEKELLLERERFIQARQTLLKLKAEEKKLDEDCLRYAAKVHKGRQKIQLIKKKVGDTDFFLQQNPYINQLVEQMVIQKATQQGNQNDLNPDNMSYQQLLQLGEQIGKVSKGLTKQQIQSLQRITYRKMKGLIEQKCSICYEQYRSSDNLIRLICEHCYHEQCLIGWMKNEKVCPLCKNQIL